MEDVTRGLGDGARRGRHAGLSGWNAVGKGSDRSLFVIEPTVIVALFFVNTAYSSCCLQSWVNSRRFDFPKIAPHMLHARAHTRARTLLHLLNQHSLHSPTIPNTHTHAHAYNRIHFKRREVTLSYGNGIDYNRKTKHVVQAKSYPLDVCIGCNAEPGAWVLRTLVTSSDPTSPHSWRVPMTFPHSSSSRIKETINSMPCVQEKNFSHHHYHHRHHIHNTQKMQTLRAFLSTEQDQVLFTNSPSFSPDQDWHRDSLPNGFVRALNVHPLGTHAYMPRPYHINLSEGTLHVSQADGTDGTSESKSHKHTPRGSVYRLTLDDDSHVLFYLQGVAATEVWPVFKDWFRKQVCNQHLGDACVRTPYECCYVHAEKHPLIKQLSVTGPTYALDCMMGNSTCEFDPVANELFGRGGVLCDMSVGAVDGIVKVCFSVCFYRRCLGGVRLHNHRQE